MPSPQPEDLSHLCHLPSQKACLTCAAGHLLQQGPVAVLPDSPAEQHQVGGRVQRRERQEAGGVPQVASAQEPRTAHPQPGPALGSLQPVGDGGEGLGHWDAFSLKWQGK